MKRKSVVCIEDLVHINIVSTSGVAPKKQKKWFIETRLVAGAATNEDKSVILVSSEETSYFLWMKCYNMMVYMNMTSWASPPSYSP